MKWQSAEQRRWMSSSGDRAMKSGDTSRRRVAQIVKSNIDRTSGYLIRYCSMMGERNPQKQLWSFQVNLDKRVRSDHPLRRINETLDLDFVRREVAKCYGTKGNVSEDPVVIMKMMLLLFLDNVRSERELMRIIPERLDYMWFLGYGLDDTIPNHSVLSKARKRWGQEVFVAVAI